MTRKGFTLIELLAILIILSIILAITIPSITGIIKQARMKAFESDAKLILKGIEYQRILYGSFDVSTINADTIDEVAQVDKSNYESIDVNEVNKKDYLISLGAGKWEGLIACGTYRDMRVNEGTDCSATNGGGTEEENNDLNTVDKNGTDYYEGANPDNWILFGRMDPNSKNGVLWRIIKKDDYGIKMVYEGIQNADKAPIEDGRALLGGTMGTQWDRNVTNKWNNPATLVNKLSSWLNNLYVININNYVNKTVWEVGGVPYEDPTVLQTFLDYQATDSTTTGGTFAGLTNYESPVGLIQAADFIYTSDNDKCLNSYREVGSNNECAYNPDNSLNNFLQKDLYHYWTMNARSDRTNMAWNITNIGLLGSSITSLSNISTRPVLNMKKTIRFLSGSGTMTDPYILENYMIGIKNGPLITLIGDSNVEIRQGDTYFDEGAYAYDDQDGYISNKIVTTGSVNPNVIGEYTITYNVTDSDGNRAIPVERMVSVIPRDKPVVELIGKNPTYIMITKPYTEVGAKATDSNYGDISSSIVIGGDPVDVNTIGTYTVTYNVTNADGVSAKEKTRKVIVEAPTPEITILGSNPSLVDLLGTYTDEGATAYDELDGDITASIQTKLSKYQNDKWVTATSVDTSHIMPYRMEYSVTNSNGRNTVAYRSINVVPAAGPIISYNPPDSKKDGVMTSGKEFNVQINVQKKQYDIKNSSLMYFTASSEDRFTDISKLFKTPYQDGQTINISGGTGYYYIYAIAKDIYEDTTMKQSGMYRIDKSNPGIELNGGDEKILLYSTYVDKGVKKAFDKYYDGDLTSKVTTSSTVNTNVAGNYHVEYKVSDSVLNTTTVYRHVEVYLPTPQIGLLQGSSINLRIGTPYVEPGYSATDPIDGDITDDVVVSGTVDHTKAGHYQLTYTVTNSTGITTTKTRVVNVYIPEPVITILGNDPVEIYKGETYSDAGATALDELDGDVTSSITVSSNINTSQAGSYSVTYTATNSRGVSSTKSRTVVVQVSGVTITLEGNNPYTMLINGTYTEPGYSAIDQLDGDITSHIQVSGNVNPSVVGSYRIYYSATNSGGDKGETYRTVIVRASNITLTLDGLDSYEIPMGNAYVEPGYHATDEIDGDITNNVNVTSDINPYVAGSYTVTYSVSNSTGGSKTATRQVIILPLEGPYIDFSKNGDITYRMSNATTVTITKNKADLASNSYKYLWKTDQGIPAQSSFVTSFNSGNEISVPNGVSGNYYLFILAKDVLGNTSILGSNSFHMDNTAPVLTLKGGSSVNMPIDSVYEDLGVSVKELDSGLNANGVVITSNINPSIIGTYTVTYSATDNVGLTSTTISRSVSVVEARLVDAPSADYVPLYDARYYVGANPSNYVEFGTSSGKPILWRIIKADDDGIKIVYEGIKNADNTAIVQNGTIGKYVFDTVNNTWNRPSSVRAVLDNFYNNLSESKKDILTSPINWCVGKISSPYALTNFKNDECTTLGNTLSRIGLVTGGDYLLTSKDPCSAYNQASCGTSNYLKKSYNYYTSSTDSVSSVAAFLVNSNGGLTRDQVTTSYDIRPVLNLRLDVLILSGEGTFERPYSLNERTADTTPPVITLNGDPTVTSEVNQVYNDLGATATDNVDGDITAKIQKASDVNPSVPGTYHVTYNVRDAAGNAAVEVVRTVIISDRLDGPGFIASKGANGPVLAAGMTPINWNGNAWVKTMPNDTNWYNYTQTDKKWANAANFNSNTLFDYSNNYHTLDYSSIVQQADGATGDAVISGFANYNFGSTVTFVARFKLTSLTDGYVMGNWEGSGGGIWFLGQRIGFELHIGSGYKNVTTTFFPTVNTFYTIVGTYDGSTMKLYVNGVLNNSLSINGNVTISPLPMCINGNPSSASSCGISLNGVINSVGIYNRALTSSEVASNFSSNVKYILDNSLLAGYKLSNVPETINNGDSIPMGRMNTMWVWVPRFAYQIASGYHTSTAGTVNIKFLKGTTNNDSNNNPVATTPTYSGSSQTNYMAHPAFTFGTTEATGMWVAKFEPTATEGVATAYTSDGSCIASDNVTTKTVRIVPNATSWRCITVGNGFTVARGMETKSIYGWGTTGNGIDTHLMKNSEFGAVALLSKSVYGKESELWNNSNINMITGCAGTAIDGVKESVCNQYQTTYGVKTSTTGNIYGIYDMAGNGYELVSAYLNNGDPNLNGMGASIISAAAKYKDIYTKASTDSDANNYALTVDKKGDAIYETSSSYNGSTSWNGDHSVMLAPTVPWFIRGGSVQTAAGSSGLYAFYRAGGNPLSTVGFRPILLVEAGL